MLIDYIKWRGDLTFAERPFTDIDQLAFCQLAYLDFSPVLTGTAMKLKDAYEQLKQMDLIKFRLAADTKQNADFAAACASSARFGELLLSDYMDILDHEKNIQFAAVTFHLDADTAFAAFRGTDDSIAGWKEDFMISYTKVPAQDYALAYAQNVLAHNKHCYLAGHSKGANLALYAAAHLPEEMQSRLRHVYLNDGPGFCKDVLELSRIEKIQHKCTRIAPEFSVVGGIFSPQIDDSRIVKSCEQQLMQHSCGSWEINADGFVTVPEYDPLSIWINELLDRFIENMDMSSRKQFVDSVFDAMAADGARTIKDFSSKGPNAFENLLIQVTGTNAPAIINSRKNRQFFDKARSNSLLRILITFCLSAFCFLLPENMMKVTIAIALFALVIYEIFLTVHYLKKAEWSFSKERPRVTACTGLVVFYILIIVKSGALFLFASAAFGIGFLVLAWQAASKYRMSKGDKAARLRYGFEAMICALLGGYILVVPEISPSWYMLSCGNLFLLDSIFELLHLWFQRKKT